MRRRLGLLGLLVLLLIPTVAWSGCPGTTTPLTPVITSIESLTVSTTVVTLTVPQKATQATIYVRSNTVAWTTDGSTPSTTNGSLAKVDTVLLVCGNAMSRLKMVRQTASDATITVTYDGHS